MDPRKVHSSPNDGGYYVLNYSSNREEESERSGIMEKSRRLRDKAVPIMIDNLFGLIPSLLYLGFAARLGDPVYVAALGLGTLFANITCLFIVNGLTEAVGQECR